MNDNVLSLAERKASATGNTLAEWQCANLLARFFQFLDEQRYDDLAALFTEEGKWHRQGKVLVGNYAILQALQARSKSLFVRHVLSCPAVTLVGDNRATVSAAVTVYAAPWDTNPVLPLLCQGPHSVLNTTATIYRPRSGAYEIAELINTPIFTFVTPTPAPPGTLAH
ncbi:MAG: nuclear transport factor 2 family protein [Pseudomonadota bacterium]